MVSFTDPLLQWRERYRKKRSRRRAKLQRALRTGQRLGRAEQPNFLDPAPNYRADRYRSRVLNRYDAQMTPSESSITVNGQTLQVPGDSTVADLLTLLRMTDRRVAVALNRSVVPRSIYCKRTITSGDRIEILEAVGGG